ncbi:hypothetical protein F4778DRAFT_780044 [Xylariomycetidae sp. FL2044]|nr:hypothetical protein F4778DRAFT_780044 [Xylariomycetidae sp. FL2044]
MAVAEQAVPLVAAVTALLFLALVSVGLRLHVRLVLLRSAGIDDWLIAIGSLMSVATYVDNMISIAYGFGKPFASLPLENRVRVSQALWISPAIWGLSSTIIKMSIVTSYLRIWTSKRFRTMCHVLLGALALFGLAMFFGGLITCIPVEVSWRDIRNMPSDKCMNKPLFMFITSSLNIAFDLFIYAMPTPLIRRLQMPKRQKIGLMVVFTIGAVVCAASVMRLVAIYQLSTAPDPSADGVNLGIWSGVEHNLMIIAACLPSIRPLISRIFPRLLSTVLSSSGGGPHHHSKTTTARASKSRSYVVNARRATFDMQPIPSHDSSEPKRDGDGEGDDIAITSTTTTTMVTNDVQHHHDVEAGYVAHPVTHEYPLRGYDPTATVTAQGGSYVWYYHEPSAHDWQYSQAEQQRHQTPYVYGGGGGGGGGTVSLLSQPPYVPPPVLIRGQGQGQGQGQSPGGGRGYIR